DVLRDPLRERRGAARGELIAMQRSATATTALSAAGPLIRAGRGNRFEEEHRPGRAGAQLRVVANGEIGNGHEPLLDPVEVDAHRTRRLRARGVRHRVRLLGVLTRTTCSPGATGTRRSGAVRAIRDLATGLTRRP